MILVNVKDLDLRGFKEKGNEDKGNNTFEDIWLECGRSDRCPGDRVVAGYSAVYQDKHYVGERPVDAATRFFDKRAFCLVACTTSPLTR